MSHDFDQTSPPAHEPDTKPVKRQRLDSTVAPDQHAHPNLALYPPKSHVDSTGSHAIATYTTQSFTDSQQLEIYYAWHQAGSPHNYVCFECRKPYNLICCKTCCRAYHIDCLPSKPPESSPQDPTKDREWHCAACKRRKWDTYPPLSHDLSSHPELHPSQASRSHSWAATSNRLETPTRKLQSFSEGHYPRRSSKLRHISDTSVEETANFSNNTPHSHPFEARPREPSRISELGELETDEVYPSEKEKTLTLHGRMPHSHGIESLSEDQITGMQAEIERLREQLGRKNSEVKELEDLRIENALLKAKVESLEAASVKEGEPNTGSSP